MESLERSKAPYMLEVLMLEYSHEDPDFLICWEDDAGNIFARRLDQVSALRLFEQLASAFRRRGVV